MRIGSARLGLVVGGDNGARARGDLGQRHAGLVEVAADAEEERAFA